VLLYQLGQTWWGILPHLAEENNSQEGPARQRGLVALKARLKTYYKQHKVQSQFNLRKMTLKWIKGKGGIKLRAKAGEASALVPFTAGLAQDFRGADGELGQHRHHSMTCLAAMCALAKQDALTEDELLEWRRLSVAHMFHYACCGFPVYPKFHYLQHLPQHILRGGVPRTYWVYSDEAKNKQVKGLWTVVSKGWAMHEQVFLRLLWLDALNNP
jgi:hypothetical protein